MQQRINDILKLCSVNATGPNKRLSGENTASAGKTPEVSYFQVS